MQSQISTIRMRTPLQVGFLVQAFSPDVDVIIVATVRIGNQRVGTRDIVMFE